MALPTTHFTPVQCANPRSHPQNHSTAPSLLILIGSKHGSSIPSPSPVPFPRFTQAAVSEDRQYLGPVVAGMVAGTASSLIRVPTEVIKQRLQTGEFKGAVTAVRGKRAGKVGMGGAAAEAANGF